VLSAAPRLGLRLLGERKRDLPKGCLGARDILWRAREPERPRPKLGGDVVLQVDDAPPLGPSFAISSRSASPS
jgi:hypothetical protein